MRVNETKGIIVNYYIDKIERKVAFCVKDDVAETIKAFEVLKEFEANVYFGDAEDIEFVYNEEDKEKIADGTYRVDSYNIILGTRVSLFCIDVYLKEV